MNNFIIKLAFIVFIISTISCSKKVYQYTGEKNFQSETGVPDYSDLKYWAAHPDKKDPSDSIPKVLRKNEKEKVADVFFLHPTTLTRERIHGETNAKIDDPIINFKTDYSTILYQASVFNENARVFAPRYRQAHIDMYFEKDYLGRKNAFDLAYEDIKNAFKYYLENENKGRPIIIASHSQGTTHAIRLLKEFFDETPLEDQLVCGYLIGMAVKKSEYKKIPICQDTSSTGCIVSWRTYREDFSSEFINRNDTSIVVVNPLNWNTTNEVVNRKMQKGAVLYNFNKVYKKTQGAQAEGNALWVTHPKFPGSILYRKQNYHEGDINLFYMDIRNDVDRRIKKYNSK